MYIDFHAHAYRKPFPCAGNRKPFPTPAQLVEYYDRHQITSGVVMPLIGPEYYGPQSNEDILEMAAEYPGRLIPFINIHPRAISNSPDAPLGELMSQYRAMGAKGLGEVICNMPITDPFMMNYYRQAQLAGFSLITMHFAVGVGGYGLIDEAGFPGLCNVLRWFPKLKILGHSPVFWSQIGTLELPEDRSRYNNYPVYEEGAVPKIMRRYSNLYGDLSAGSGFSALNRDHEFAVRFLNEFQDRLVFGLDICNPPGIEPPPLALLLRKFQEEGKISEEVFNKVARLNAEKLLKETA